MHSVRNDGAFELGRQLSWAWQQIIEDSKDPVTRARLQNARIEDWYTAMPLRKGQSPLASAPSYEDYYLDEAAHADDDTYWHSIGMNWQQYSAQTADVPMLHIGGWYDIYLRRTVMGPVKIHLFAASSGTDTDFTAKLIDVYPPSSGYPDGFAMNLTDGIRRARYRDGLHQGRLIEPTTHRPTNGAPVRPFRPDMSPCRT
jgi:predicted acyl esterase